MAKLLTFDGQVIDPTAYIEREREKKKERERERASEDFTGVLGAPSPISMLYPDPDSTPALQLQFLQNVVTGNNALRNFQ